MLSLSIVITNHLFTSHFEQNLQWVLGG